MLGGNQKQKCCLSMSYVLCSKALEYQGNHTQQGFRVKTTQIIFNIL